MRRLIVNPGTDSEWAMPLPAGVIKAGRGPENDLVLEHPSVSDQHCEITNRHSAVTIRDLGSAKGTFIDEQPVTESLWLTAQTLRLGDVQLRWEETIALNERPPVLIERSPAELTSDRPFLNQVLSAFNYPFQGDGMVLLCVGVLLFFLMRLVMLIVQFAFLIGGLVMILLALYMTGFLTAYLRRVITSTALGDATMPDWPDVDDFADDILRPVFQLLSTVLISFAPAIGLLVYAATHDYRSLNWLDWALPGCGLLGCVYFPMAFLAVAMFDSVGALNPLLVIPAIFRVLRHYCLTVLMLAAILVLRWVVLERLAAHTRFLPLLPGILMNFVGLYLLVVEMRILGLLYQNKKVELDWF